MADKPSVWFERAVLPDLVEVVSAQCEILGPGPADDPFSGVEPARGIVAGALVYDDGVMAAAPELRVIARTGIGVDRVDVEAATRRGIAVCNTPSGPTVSTAEHAVALMLMVAKNIKQSARSLRRGEVGLFADHDAVELDGKTLGLVGFGRIARRVAAAAGALGMTVQAFDPFLEDLDGVARLDDLTSLLATSDVVSVHVPLTEATRHMFGTAEFDAMKPGAIFVNTARGGLVDQDALLAALDAGRLFGAGLDVTDPEPLPRGHVLLERDNVVVTPHVASGTREGKHRTFTMAFEQVVQVLNGNRPANLVNPEVWH